MAKQRPLGITLIAIASLVLAGLSLVWSLFVMGFGGVTGMTASLFSANQVAALGGSAFVSGGIGIISAILHVIVAIGLLRLKKWAWILTLIVYGWTVIQGIVGIFGGGLFALCCGGLGLLLPVVIFIYLLRPGVRDAFDQ
jgi:hypothetical protein